MSKPRTSQASDNNPNSDHTRSDSSVTDSNPDSLKSFENAAEEDELSLTQEFFLFLKEHKAWWLVPILLALAFLAAIAWLNATGAAPFIYPLF